MSQGVKRTFFAVDLSEYVIPVVEKVESDFPALKKSVRFIHRHSGTHLTLKFLGDTDEKQIPGIIEKVKEMEKRFSPFSILIKGTGVFPNQRNPRILWFGVNDPKNNLQLLSREINDILGNFGYRKEKKPFKPHITIGRVRKKLERTELKSFLEFNYEPIMVTIKSFYFFESILLPSGAKYLRLGAFNLMKEGQL